MKSRRVIEIPVEELGLQAVIKPYSPSKSDHQRISDIKNIKDNLKVEYALLRDRVRPSIAYKRDDIRLREIYYNDEVPSELYLEMLTDKEYEIFNPETKFKATGRIGELFSHEDFSFIVYSNTIEPLSGNKYIISLSPLI